MTLAVACTADADSGAGTGSWNGSGGGAVLASLRPSAGIGIAPDGFEAHGSGAGRGAQPAAGYAAHGAVDLVDGAVDALCWPRLGSPIAWGTTEAVCIAYDAAGNPAIARFSINATEGW